MSGVEVLGGQWTITDPSGDVIAIALVSINYPRIGVAIIDHFEVREEYRRRGIGTSLLNTICAQADNNKVPLMLDMPATGENVEWLRKFYEKRGFRKSSLLMRLEREPRG